MLLTTTGKSIEVDSEGMETNRGISVEKARDLTLMGTKKERKDWDHVPGTEPGDFLKLYPLKRKGSISVLFLSPM